MKRLDGSYRIESKWYLTQESTIPQSVSQANFDYQEGISSSFGTNVSVPGIFGRIDVQHSSIISQNPIAYWTGGKFGKDDEFLFQSLLRVSGKWKIDIDVNNDEVVIRHPYQPSYRDTPVGTRTLHCLISKGLLPIKVDIDYKDEDLGKGFWRKEEMWIDPIKSDDLWMPSVIKHHIRTSVLGENVCAIQLTAIKALSLGKVSKPQLAIVFPSRTKLVDIPKGVSYEVGENGRLAGPVTGLYSPAELTSQKTAPRLRYILLAVTFLLVIVLCFLVIRKRRGSEEV
jgi:hypothetical protein